MIRFMSHEERLELQPVAPYRVMVFTPRGQYPEGTYFVENGFFHADSELAFSLVKSESWGHSDPDIPHSDFDWAAPHELRLMASLVLCEKRFGPLIMFYPVVSYSPCLDKLEVDVRAPETVADVRALLLQRIRNATRRGNDGLLYNQFNGSYELVPCNEFNMERLEVIWSSLTTSRYVALRAVRALIKSDMLSKHYEFLEEAVISTYIAMEASFSLVLRRLAMEGCENPNAHEAARWLHRHFDSHFGMDMPGSASKYFGEFYIERIMALHPASRFGDLPFSPMMRSDLFHLRRALREIVAYLVTGSHSSDFYESVRSNSRFIDG